MTDLDWVLKERERHRLKSRLARENSKASKPNIKHQSKWIKKNPLKRATHHIVAAALKSNRLTKKPCEVCGSKRSQAHHEDYLQPLEVTWLCSKHHAARHIALREETIRQSFGF